MTSHHHHLEEATGTAPATLTLDDGEVLLRDEAPAGIRLFVTTEPGSTVSHLLKADDIAALFRFLITTVHELPTSMALVNQEDAEDCEMCAAVATEPCAYHHGVSVGVGWMSRMMIAAAQDPEIVSAALDRREANLRRAEEATHG